MNFLQTNEDVLFTKYLRVKTTNAFHEKGTIFEHELFENSFSLKIINYLVGQQTIHFPDNPPISSDVNEKISLSALKDYLNDEGQYTYDQSYQSYQYDNIPLEHLKLFDQGFLIYTGNKKSPTLKFMGDTVYRVILKSSVPIIKKVQLSNCHVSGSVDFFLTEEDAQAELNRIEKQKESGYKSSEVIDILEDLVLTVKGFEDKSIKDIKKNMSNLIDRASKVLNWE